MRSTKIKMSRRLFTIYSDFRHPVVMKLFKLKDEDTDLAKLVLTQVSGSIAYSKNSFVAYVKLLAFRYNSVL